MNVSTEIERIHIAFSEFVDRNSVPGALSITPELQGRLRFEWSSQAVDVELPTSLRDSTTYIVSLSPDLADANGVSLESPITFAFSTGPRIDQGQIHGRVVSAGRGQPEQQVDVFAYPTTDTAQTEPRPFPERAPFRTQTGEDGSFDLTHLPSQRFFVVAVRDNNRNRRIDAGEPTAAPPHPALPADSGASDVPIPWILTQVDTVGPSFQQAQPLSRQRLRLSFDEPVRLADRDPDAWTLRDSASGGEVAIHSVYTSSSRSDALLVRTEAMETVRYQLPISPDLVTDTVGHSVARDTARFSGVDRQDTTRTRFRGFLPQNLPRDTTGARLLPPDGPPGIRFNQPPDTSRIRRMVTVQDRTEEPWSYGVKTENGRSFHLRLGPALQAEEMATVAIDLSLIAGPDSTVRRRFRRIPNRQLGALEGRIPLSDQTLASPQMAKDFSADNETAARGPTESGGLDSTVAELHVEEAFVPVDVRRQTVAPGSTFVFERVPEGQFRFRAFLDRNGNEQWDRGSVQPYRPPEPLTWSREVVESRPRWTTVLPGPLRVPVFQLVAPGREGRTPADTTTPEPPNPTDSLFVPPS